MAKPEEVGAEDSGAEERPAGADGAHGGADETRILFCRRSRRRIGRRTLLECLPELRERYEPTFVVVNGENVAGGLGITPKAARALFAAGVDAITLGNHTYHRREIYPYLDSEPRICGPPTSCASSRATARPCSGATVSALAWSTSAAISTCAPAARRSPRSTTALSELEGQQVDHILVDMHAEATSEKVALGWLLDGRVSAVVGTHTHIPTADARVLPGGTAYITDVGMTGPRGGVIGVKRESGDRGAAHADADALRDLRRGPVADGGADRVAPPHGCERTRSSRS